jgi:hypothetical protein
MQDLKSVNSDMGQFPGDKAGAIAKVQAAAVEADSLRQA